MEKQHFELLYGETNSIVYAESLTSTQDYLQQNWRELSQFAVCIADFQTQGRGRYRRIWQAPAKSSLLLSVLLELPQNPNYAVATLAGALAARQACAQVANTEKIFLKWPNDVVDRKGRKIAGVLGEVLGQRDGKLVAALGVGVNITQTAQDLLPTATSLQQIYPQMNRDFCQIRQVLAAKFLTELKKYLHCEKQLLFSLLQYHCIDIGKIRHYRIGAAEFSGIVRAINRDGSLLVGERAIHQDEIAQLALSETDF